MNMVARLVLLVILAASAGAKETTLQVIARYMPIDSITNKPTYSEVVQVEGALAGELYSRAKLWVANTYKSAEAVIDMDEKNSATIIVKGRFSIKFMTGPWDIRHTVTISAKDGRYRYTINNLGFVSEPEYIKGVGTFPAHDEDIDSMTKQTEKVYERINLGVQAIIASLRAGMVAPTPGAASDW